MTKYTDNQFIPLKRKQMFLGEGEILHRLLHAKITHLELIDGKLNRENN